MAERRLPRLAATIVERIAPARWRESIIGDLEEEHARRHAAGRLAGPMWAATAALTSSVRLRRAQRTPVEAGSSPAPAPNRARFSGFGSELRQMLRAFRQHPGFALITVLTLTLGIGANTIVFSLANWLMFRPVPGVSRPDDLVSMRIEFKSGDGGFYFWSVPEMQRVAGTPGLASVAAAAASSFHIVIGDAAPIRVEGGVATTNYFDVLGQHMTRGRAFSPREDDPGLASVAIVSDHFWHSTLGGDPAVIGRRIVLNGHTFEIIGVAERGFRGPDRSGHEDIWVPLASFRQSMPSYPATLLTGKVSLFASLLARKDPGVTVEQIRDRLKNVLASLQTTDPKNFKYPRAMISARAGLDVPAWQRDGLRQMFALLLTVAGLLLLLTCANVANLLFARTHERAAELATRQALGASRAQVVRQLLLEGLVLSSAGTGLALVAAMAAGAWMNGLVVGRNLPALSTVPIDWRVFAFACATSIVTSVAASLLPAVFGSRVDLLTTLRQGGRGHSPAGRGVRRILTTVQVGIAVALLSVGLLLVRSMLARYQVPLGYDTKNVLAFSIDASAQGYSEDRTRHLYADALDALRQIPGVTAAGVAWVEPFKPIGGGLSLKPVDSPDFKPVSGDTNNVSEGFFPALGVRFLSGRDFTPSETLLTKGIGDKPVIVNETMARKLFGSTNVVGRVVDASYPEGTRLTIVGVVSNIRTRNVSYDDVSATAYQPFGQGFLSGWGTLHVRLNTPAAAVIPRVRETMRAIDPQLPIYDVELLSDAVDRYLAESRLLTTTIGAFAVVATLVAALGLYGVLSRGVEERRREFSVRVALGAEPFAIARLVAREAMLLTLAGGVIGLAAAALIGQTIKARLFGVVPVDPASLGLAMAVVIAAALLSALAPARRAARMDVVAELR